MLPDEWFDNADDANPLTATDREYLQLVEDESREWQESAEGKAFLEAARSRAIARQDGQPDRLNPEDVAALLGAEIVGPARRRP